MKNKALPLIALAIALLTAGCWRDVPMREATAQHLAMPSFMIQREIKAEPFVLTAYERVRAPGQTATVYIEGDGMAWVSRRTPSLDPTPINPTALHLATQDKSANVIYLARPCQYSRERTPQICKIDYWTGKRFAPEIITAMNTALDNMKARYDLTGLDLIGYSGGGGIAVLLAAQRNDVLSIRTVAGNLDTDVFTRMHEISPMKGSENPAHSAALVSHIPQQHFIGAWDKVVTAALFESFRQASGSERCLRHTLVQDTDHEDGWVSRWSDLLKAPLDCNNY